MTGKPFSFWVAVWVAESGVLGLGSGCRDRRPAGEHYAVLTALRMDEKSLLVGMTNRQRPSLRDSHTAPTARSHGLISAQGYVRHEA